MWIGGILEVDEHWGGKLEQVLLKLMAGDSGGQTLNSDLGTHGDNGLLQPRCSCASKLDGSHWFKQG